MFLTNHSSAFLLHDVRVVKNVACLSSLIIQLVTIRISSFRRFTASPISLTTKEKKVLNRQHKIPENLNSVCLEDH